MSVVSMVDSKSIQRAVRTYTLPESARQEADAGYKVPNTVGIRQLTAAEELKAAEVARGNYTKLQYETIKAEIFEFDGKSVNNGDGAIDTFWEHCGPIIRSLLAEVHARTSTPSKEVEKDFFDSVKIRV